MEYRTGISANVACKKILFDESHKWIVPRPTTDPDYLDLTRNRLLIASMAKNLEGLGFRFDAELANKLERLDESVLITTLHDIYHACEEEIGAKELSHARVMYPNFPDEVMSMDELELFVNQMVYYFGEYYLGVEILPEQNEMEREPLVEGFNRDLKLLHFGTQENLDELMKQRILSGISLSESQMEDIRTYTDRFGFTKTFMLYQNQPIPNKENACQLAKMAYDYSMKNYGAVSESIRYALHKTLPTGMDVLRFAALLSNGKTIHEKEKYRTAVWNNSDQSDRKIAWRTRRVDVKIDNDASLSKPVKFKLNRTEEKLIKGLLAESKSLFEDVWMRPSLYKTLGKQISMTRSCPERLTKAYDNLGHNNRVNEKGDPIHTPYSFMDIAVSELAKGSAKTAEFVAKNFPGVYSRGFVRLLNNAKNVAQFMTLCDYYETYCDKVPIKNQIKLLNYLQSIPNQDSRVIYESKINRYVKTDMPEFKYKDFMDCALNAVLSALDKQLEQGTSLGKVYIDPDLMDIALPGNNERAASKGNDLPMGSVMNGNQDCNIIRTFVWWTNNGNERIDIDSSVVFLDDEMRQIENCSYFNTRADVSNAKAHLTKVKADVVRHHNPDDNIGKEIDDIINRMENLPDRFLAVHSGDYVDGGPEDGAGVAEYVDIDKNLCKEVGIRYVVMSVHAYTNEPFNEIPNLKWGFMQREGSLDMGVGREHHQECDAFSFNGQIYEPSTVECCVDINTKSTQTIPAIYDLEQDRFIWLDQPIRTFDEEIQNIYHSEFREQMKLLIEYQNQRCSGDLYQLFAFHALNRGELVNDIKDADIIFTKKDLDRAELGISEEVEIVSAHDYSKIVSEFLTIPEPNEQKLEELEYEIDPDDVGDNIDR